MTSRAKLVAGAVAFAMAAMGADGCTTNPRTEAEKAPASDQSARDEPSPTTRQAPEPAGQYDLNCAYERGVVNRVSTCFARHMLRVR
jgi:hypothetical protein